MKTSARLGFWFPLLILALGADFAAASPMHTYLCDISDGISVAGQPAYDQLRFDINDPRETSIVGKVYLGSRKNPDAHWNLRPDAGGKLYSSKGVITGASLERKYFGDGYTWEASVNLTEFSKPIARGSRTLTAVQPRVSISFENLHRQPGERSYWYSSYRPSCCPNGYFLSTDRKSGNVCLKR